MKRKTNKPALFLVIFGSLAILALAATHTSKTPEVETKFQIQAVSSTGKQSKVILN